MFRTSIEYGGMVWLKLGAAPIVDVTGAIRFGSVIVLVEANPAPDSETSVALAPTEFVPSRWIATGCGFEDAFTSFRNTWPLFFVTE